MTSRNFDRFSSAFTRSDNRRDALRLLGQAGGGKGSAGRTSERTLSGAGAARSFRFTDQATNDHRGSINVGIACA